MVKFAGLGAAAPPSLQVEANMPTRSMVLPEASSRSMPRAVLPMGCKVR